MTLLRDPHLHLWDCFGPGILAAYGDRTYSFGRRDRLLSALDIDPARLMLSRQVHGNGVIYAAGPREPVDGDALWTDRPGVAVGVLTADCIPIFLADAHARIIAVLHGGWRGLREGIVGKAVGVLQEKGGDRGRLQAALGPAIRRCCYEVGPEFEDFFPGLIEGGHMDLIRAARRDLMQAGILADHIEDSGICTACESGRFPSFRRTRTEERMLSVMMLR